MASIDQYKHRLLGFLDCPSDFDIVHANTTRKIAIYQLLEDVPNSETKFDGKINDIILGGGSGECPSLRICNEKINFFLKDDFDNFEELTDIYRNFWTPNFSFIIGNGFAKLGWNPQSDQLDFWVANLVVKQIKGELETETNKR